jgi:hypothetical protein
LPVDHERLCAFGGTSAVVPDDRPTETRTTRALLADVTAALAADERPGAAPRADERTVATLARSLYVAGGGAAAVDERLDDRHRLETGVAAVLDDEGSLVDRLDRARALGAVAARELDGSESVATAVDRTVPGGADASLADATAAARRVVEASRDRREPDRPDRFARAAYAATKALYVCAAPDAEAAYRDLRRFETTVRTADDPVAAADAAGDRLADRGTAREAARRVVDGVDRRVAVDEDRDPDRGPDRSR